MTTRITLTLDDEVYAAAKRMAKDERKTLGDVVSALVRTALVADQVTVYRNGIPQFPSQHGSSQVTIEIVNQLRDRLED